MIVFFLGCWVTMKYIWPPMLRAIDERRSKIAEGLAAADRSAQALEEAQTKGREIEAEARARATTIVSDSEKRGTRIVDDAKAQALKEAERIVSNAEAQAAQQMEQARLQLRGELAALVVQGAAQILRSEVDAGAHAKLIEQLEAKL